MLSDKKEVQKRGRKPLPAPSVAGETEYERFENLAKRVLGQIPKRKKKKARKR